VVAVVVAEVVLLPNVRVALVVQVIVALLTGLRR
jgi:hypothetical protein